jgi:UDP-3-O-[3-hydroxymyristoyl] N-acetylglucosamine deacetylase
MDGLPSNMLPVSLQSRLDGRQRTLRAAIDCVGVGLHSGRRVTMVLAPAPAGTGVVFRRADLPGRPAISARHDRVVDTRMCTVLGDPTDPELRVGTVEHVLAALAGLGVGNAIIEVDGPEVPILDGSAADIVFLIGCAGVVEQDEAATVIEVLRPVRVEHGRAFAELRPGRDTLDLAMSIDFEAAAIGRQALTLRLTPESFRRDLADSRTFALADEVGRLREMGLALGGNLANAVVVEGARVLNPTGLRHADEFVRHKMLDAVGDLSLAGAPLRGRFIGHCSGHALNNRLLRDLFASPANWRAVATEPSWEPMSVAAA